MRGPGPCARGISFSNTAEKGFTLLEIIVVIALFSIVALTLLSLSLFSANILQKGVRLLDLQQNVRIAADFIIRDLRYANTLQVISKKEIKYRLPGDSISYTIKQKNAEIVILFNKAENKIAYDIDDLIMDWDELKKILTLEIVGSEDGRSYAVRTAVRLLNLH